MSLIINPYSVDSGAPAFSPADVGGLKLWLRADSLGLADGDPIALWEDQSGNGNDFIQSASSARPTYQTNEFGSMPVVRFDGSDDSLALGAGGSIIANNFDYSIFAVVKPLSAPSDYDPIIINTNGQGYRVCLKTSSATWGSYSGSGDINATTTLSTGTIYRIAVTYDNAVNARFYLNNVEETTSGSLNGATTVETIGAEPTPNRYAHMDLSELLIYDNAVSSTDRDLIDAYLDSRY